MPDVLIWGLIILCISQSAMFSGLNLALFSIPKLKLAIMAKNGNKNAKKLLDLRENANFLLATILWGNVGVNVVLTLLSDSVMTGVISFLFSTVAITLFGEIAPQAYFSRHALRMASIFYPVVRFYQFLLYPLAYTSALVLNKLIGEEAVQYYHEQDLVDIITSHGEEEGAGEISLVEAKGAVNFLHFDELTLKAEAERVDPKSIIELPFDGKRPLFPVYESEPEDEFLTKIKQSDKKWVIITDKQNHPRLLLDADGFLREALWNRVPISPLKYCHKPLFVTDPDAKLGRLITKLRVQPEHNDDDVIDKDVILLWQPHFKGILTGADILGRLLRGISENSGD